MAIPTQLSDLSATAASNSPAGGDTVGTTMDDYLRAIQSIIVRISAGTDAMATPNIGAATGTSLVLSGLATVNGAFTSLGLDDNATAKALTLSGSGANSVTIANSATNPTIGTSAGDLVFSPAGLGTAFRIGAVAGAINYLSTAGSATIDPLLSSNTGSLFVGGTSANPEVRVIFSGASTRHITLAGSNGGNPTIGTSAGQLTLGTGSALATSATEGYVCIPTCAGAPTGVPTGAGAGNLPLIYDTTNNKLYAYNGAWKATAALT